MRRLTSKDMAKIACSACEGCGECCRGMGDTIHLDPLDVQRLREGLHSSFGELLDKVIALHVEDGLILPHLLQTPGERGQCVFLDEDGRCRIHSFRPGLCRLFPLGRDYDGDKFAYFVVDGGCRKEGKVKIRIDKWLGISPSELPRYERFVADWHYFVRDTQRALSGVDEARAKEINLAILGLFYGEAYPDSFYDHFERRLLEARTML